MLTAVITRGLEHIGDALVGIGSADAPTSGDRRATDSTAAPQAEPDPVVLVGGFATTAPLLRPMTRWLESRGHAVTGFAVGAGLDCAQHTVDQLAAEVRTVAEGSGRPVHLVGHSRGGQFARAVAGQTPDQLASLVTIGTPFDLFGLRLHTLLAAATLAAAGTIGVRHCARWSCIAGECCRHFRAGLRRPCPPGVRFTSIYSDSDGVVPAQSSIDPTADNVRVTGRHLDLLTGHHARQAVADALATAGDGRVAHRRPGPRNHRTRTGTAARSAAA